MAFQADVIPATGTDYFTTNIEDGVALADGSLRDAFASGYPAAWARIRRAGGSCANHSGSSCTTTSCRSPISPRTCRRSCSGRTAR